MNYFNDKGHLTDEALSIYAEALKLDRQEQLPEALRGHLDSCLHCQEQAMALYSLIAGQDYSELGPHPTFSPGGGSSSAATLKMWFRPILLLFMALLAVFFFRQQQQQGQQGGSFHRVARQNALDFLFRFLRKRKHQRSTSPITMSILPMMATTSAM